MGRGLGEQQRWVIAYLCDRDLRDAPDLDRSGIGANVFLSPRDARQVRLGVWFVTLSEIARARFGPSPTKSQTESLRQTLHRLSRDGLINLQISVGELVVDSFDRDLHDEDPGVIVGRQKAAAREWYAMVAGRTLDRRSE